MRARARIKRDKIKWNKKTTTKQRTAREKHGPNESNLFLSVRIATRDYYNNSNAPFTSRRVEQDHDLGVGFGGRIGAFSDGGGDRLPTGFEIGELLSFEFRKFSQTRRTPAGEGRWRSAGFLMRYCGRVMMTSVRKWSAVFSPGVRPKMAPGRAQPRSRRLYVTACSRHFLAADDRRVRRLRHRVRRRTQRWIESSLVRWTARQSPRMSRGDNWFA